MEILVIRILLVIEGVIRSAIIAKGVGMGLINVIGCMDFQMGMDIRPRFAGKAHSGSGNGVSHQEYNENAAVIVLLNEF